jgi:hypothetical protein
MNTENERCCYNSQRNETVEAEAARLDVDVLTVLNNIRCDECFQYQYREWAVRDSARTLRTISKILNRS